MHQSLEDVHSLNDPEESPLEKELSQVRIVRHWEVQVRSFQQCQAIISTNSCMMEPHPKLTKDGTAKLHSGWSRFAGKENASKDICKEFRIIPADQLGMEGEDQVAIGNLLTLTLCQLCINADTTFPIGIVTMSTNCIEHARVLKSPVHDLFQWDNTLGMKLMCKDGSRSGSNLSLGSHLG